jgi:hypothetical protein
MLSRLLHLLPRLILFWIIASGLASAEDIPLDTCDGLPVIEVSLSGGKHGSPKSTLRFLVDTAATSMLNSRSFREGDPISVFVTSWSGTVETKSRRVTLHEIIIGQHSLKDLQLPAVDLSVIGETCGKRIDGILGFDLLSRLGMTVDLKNHTAQLLPDAKSTEAVVAELHDQLNGCEISFNRGDETAFAQCLDPGIVMFTVGGDFYGRDHVIEYYRKKYFQHDPPGHITMTHRAHHLIGDAIWLEYDLKITLGEQMIQARGTALCRKNSGRWLIVHMNHSSPPAPDLKAQKDE